MPRDVGKEFRALHRKGDPFILANAWDAGSAKMLAALGAEAIGTSSAAHAFTLGRTDGGTVDREEALAHAQEMVAAVNLPVSGDFEDGFGKDPETCAETVRLAAEAGLAGISIEDTDFSEGTHFGFELAVERIRAAAAASRALGRDFVLVARADGILNGSYRLEEALNRIRAFDEAGADCLYVPMPPGLQSLKFVVRATEKPVNALAAGPFARFTRSDFAEAGIARISLGSALARLTCRVVDDAARSMFGAGDFTPLLAAMPTDRVADCLSGTTGETEEQ
ncbi:MAG: isocitrate lyase/phosphoenolpyruvate mutase family protein [Boseongicola sp.]|nr:isocitrate lyase/phosphoenolpyruvate mutase family protein [Boseongicola sp.]